MKPPLVVWQFTDGKPGHESQSRGLIAALRRRTDVHAYSIPVDTCRCGVASLLWRRHPCQFDFPPPDFILACGRSTHFAALAARRACGGRLISLMKPPLPIRLYDLCLIPEHDGVPPAADVVLTRGVLNPIAPAPQSPHRQGHGLLLIGGPSGHHGWNGVELARQVADIALRDPRREWTLTTSRRTPDDFVTLLQNTLAGWPQSARLDIVPADQTPPGWVAAQLARCDAAVVTEDSVSMVYESLTAGVSVALIPMPRRGKSRVITGVERLLHDGVVTTADRYLETAQFPPARHTLAEADRCATHLLARWHTRAVRAA